MQAPSQTSAVESAPADEAIYGTWHRAQSCAEMLAAFEAVGLAESQRGWLQGNFFGGQEGPSSGDPCEGASGPLEHSHFFTESMQFGSGDEHGEEVDDGDFAMVDADTLSFPSHASEFGYDGEILVDYAVNGDTVVFTVTPPQPCPDACATAHAWALSAFASGPWQRGEVPTSSPSAAGPQRFAVAEDGRELVILCEGEGSPTVILEDGIPSETGGIVRFAGGPLWDDLVAETRVCAYDRAGYGAADPAPNEPRSADDVVDDLHALLAAAGEDGPFVLVGSSGGGMIVTYYAARQPDSVARVVLLDVPAPTDTLTVEEVPEVAWDHPTNPEHLDIVPEFETRFARNPEPMQAPLVVITATEGQSDVEDQSFWLQVSPDATQVELEGGHDIDFDNPAGVLEQILAAVEAAR